VLALRPPGNVAACPHFRKGDPALSRRVLRQYLLGMEPIQPGDLKEQFALPQNAQVRRQFDGNLRLDRDCQISQADGRHAMNHLSAARQ
jgi:hypothetical protein